MDHFYSPKRSLKFTKTLKYPAWILASVHLQKFFNLDYLRYDLNI